jgi:nitroimidazol reductase NimA-like FMN-containing flavoprotein (pyridoxamine 5'-phosphate oxidase superfamily)
LQDKKISSAASHIPLKAGIMTNQLYHMRRTEREILDEQELRSIVSRAKYMTVAMCKNSEPYLVTVNHVCDSEAKAIYFHCAKEGKKVEFLESNPRVFGEVMEDRGYVEGECDYDYRSVHFKGRASKVSDLTEKRKALDLMIEKLEKNPEVAKKEFIDKSSLMNVMIFRIDIETMTGKKRVP